MSQLVITSLLNAHFKTAPSYLLQCFLSKSVWTSPHIQMVHSSATGANHSSSYSPPNYSQRPVYFTAPLLCLDPYMDLRCCEYESYSSLRTIPQGEERRGTGSVLTRWTRVSSLSGQDRKLVFPLIRDIWAVNYLLLNLPDTFCMPPQLTYNDHEILFC